MATIHKSLQTITTGHSVFEQNQVLTSGQLNSVADYADDQVRLTRIKLSGVGLVTGLRVSLDERSRVSLSPGLGVTTDGDLMQVDTALLHTHYKSYDQSFPRYAPFFSGEETMLTLYELVPSGVTDPRARPLSSFEADTGTKLSDLSGLLLMESYLSDDDLCSGTDCDNLGQDAVHTQKLLLLSRASAARLRESLPTLAEAFRSISEITVPRPVIAAGTNSVQDLASAFLAPCRSVMSTLSSNLNGLIKALTRPLSDPLRPLPNNKTWRATLENNLSAATSAGVAGLQYFYDHLKDIAETVAEIHEAVFADDTWLCTDVDAFPKHLLLGDLVPGSDADANRTRWYPSPANGAGGQTAERVRFALSRLDRMIRSFHLDSGGARTPIRITPSAFEDSPLDQRAIPYYYSVSATDTASLQRWWSYRRTRQGTWNRQLSWSASTWSTDSAVTAPLGVQTGRYPFFRVEGHIGWDIERAVAELKAQIAARNVPIHIQAIYAGTERGRIVVKPPLRYSDLNRMHTLLRQDALYQLDDVIQYSDTYNANVKAAISSPSTSNVPSEYKSTSVATLADNETRNVKTYAQSAKSRLSGSYRDYATHRATTAGSWSSDVVATMQSAGTLQHELSPVAPTLVATPFDTLLSATQIRWIDWLDELIDQKDEKEDEKLLISTFVGQHPGLEHFAGTPRGGTLVLVYDDEAQVVADFSLPYICCEDEPVAEPELSAPSIRPTWNFADMTRILKPRDVLLRTQLDLSLAEVETSLTARQVDFQEAYIDTVFNLSAKTNPVNPGGTDVIIKDPGVEVIKEPGVEVVKDPGVEILNEPGVDVLVRDTTLDRQVTDTRAALTRLAGLRKKLGTSADEAQRAELANMEREAAVGVLSAWKALGASDRTIAEGSDGAALVATLTESMAALSPELQAVVAKGLASMSADAASPEIGKAMAKAAAGVLG